MKKTNIRVRRNGGSKSASPQVPNKPVSLVLFTHEGDAGEDMMEIAGLDYSAEEFAQIQKVAAANGESLPAFLESAIRAKLDQAASLPSRTQPKTVTPQTTGAAVKPWWHSDSLQLLINGNAEVEDCLWASPEGQLYLWDGGFDREPCEVTFDIAREWWEKFHNPKIEFASPHFEEDTAAARLVSVVCDDWKKRQAKTAQELARPNLEDAVRASAALTSLLFAHVGSPNAATIVPMDRDTFNCGVMLLCQTTNDRLLAAYYGETKSHLAADRRAV